MPDAKPEKSFDKWLSGKDKRSVKAAEEKAAFEAKKRELRDGPSLTLADDAVDVLEQHQRYIVTASMNNIGINIPFWKSIRRYAKENNAQIIVAPIRYRNPTSPDEYKVDGSGWWWPDEVKEYLCGSTIRLHQRLWFMGDIKVQATASNPLSGLDILGRGASTIFGHAQVAMQTVPTPQYDLPKIMVSTGSCSLPNYSESRAGAKAQFNHSNSALVVEKDGNAFHFRHVSADSEGGFYDLDCYYHEKGVEKGQAVSAIILGDTHVWWNDEKVRKATFTSQDSMINVLKPKKIVHHDLIDAYSITHHHNNDPITRIAKMKGNKNALLSELNDVIKYLVETTPVKAEIIVIGSNHHDHITRWILESDWKADLTNAETYLELALEMVRKAEMTRNGAKTIDPFASWIMARLPSKLASRTTFVEREVSYRLHGIELNLHGDRGPNGSRGSLKSLSRIGTKVVIGHSHTPGIEKGAYQVGTSTSLQMEYHKGAPSSWLNTHCIIYRNGKRTLVNIIDGKWKAK